MGPDAKPVHSVSAVPAGLGIALAIVAVPALILYVQNVEAKFMRGYGNRLEEAGAALTKYLDASPNHMGPRLSRAPGMLSFDDNKASANTNQALFDLTNNIYPNSYPDDSNLLYFGYMVEDEDDLNALAAYYTDKMARGEPLEDVIPLPKPRRDGRNVLLRLQLLKDQPPGSAWSNWYRYPAVLPVFIERTCVDGRGGHVLFLDGHVAYYPYSRSNVWPCDRHTLGPLTKMDSALPETR
jgi:prepilin-type processing-associated H-X9-DG protein